MNDTKLSKLLSLALRHDPSAIGIEVDVHGWASVKAVAAGASVSASDIERVVAASDKRRFALTDDGNFVRAVQGHSIKVDLELLPIEPPAILYHGTATRFLDSIAATGLESRERRHVHLSADAETAITVGSRHGSPVVLHVNAAKVHSTGQAFYLSENDVWLTGPIAPEYLVFPE